jgi:hypothetical protein
MRGAKAVKQVTAKVYAAFFPADEAALRAVEAAAAGAMGPDPARISLNGDILRISWEGIHFPVEDVLSALAGALEEPAEGKLDSIDLDAWTLTRHTLTREPGKQAFFLAGTRGLNQILAYSGL